MEAEFERLAYDAAVRALDKQERLLEELRARTGTLLAASAVAASFLGRAAFADPPSDLVAVLALIAFVVSIGASVYVLTPREGFVFSQAGPALYEGLYAIREDLAEVYRRLAYHLLDDGESTQASRESFPAPSSAAYPRAWAARGARRIQRR